MFTWLIDWLIDLVESNWNFIFTLFFIYRHIVCVFVCVWFAILQIWNLFLQKQRINKTHDIEKDLNYLIIWIDQKFYPLSLSLYFDHSTGQIKSLTFKVVYKMTKFFKFIISHEWMNERMTYFIIFFFFLIITVVFVVVVVVCLFAIYIYWLLFQSYVIYSHFNNRCDIADRLFHVMSWINTIFSFRN